MAKPELKQTFETTVVFSSKKALHFYFVPTEVFGEGGHTIDALQQDSEFKLQGAIDVRPAHLAAALHALMENRDEVEVGAQALPELQRRLSTTFEYASMNAKLAGFEVAEQAAYARIVPSESSPLDLNSLADLLLQGAGAKLGIWVATAVAGAGAPIAAPVLIGAAVGGVVIVAAVQGLAKGAGSTVGQGIGNWVLRKLGSRPPNA